MPTSIADQIEWSAKHEKSALRSYTTRSEIFLDDCGFQLRDYQWDQPREDAWDAPFHLIDFSLTPRPRPAWAPFLDGRSNVRKPLGRIMFIPAGLQIRSGAASGTQRSLSCFLGPTLLDDLLPHAPAWSETALEEALHLSSSEVEWLLLRIDQELRQPGFATRVMLEATASALAVALIPHFALDSGVAGTTRSGGLAPWRLRRIHDRVHANAPAPQLTELVDLCGMSVRHLTRAFKTETGETIAAFVQRATVARAHTLLTDTSLSMGEISAALGFASATSFSYAFRRATGQRPGELRASLRNRGADRKMRP